MSVPTPSVAVWTFHNTVHASEVAWAAVAVEAAVAACGPDSLQLLGPGSSPEIEQQSPW